MMHRQSSQSSLDESPTADLYHRHAPALFAYLRSQKLSREDAEDLLLEVFLTTLTQSKLADWSEEDQRAWLKKVARNKLVDLYRRTKKRSLVALDAVAETLYADEAHAPEEVALQREAEDRLRDLIGRLSDTQQQVLRLHFGEGLRCVEIARRQGKGEGAVRMVLSRALNLLRTYYTER
jgi:RNA polymerase sigma-70 factor (ECF subfamily)